MLPIYLIDAIHNKMEEQRSELNMQVGVRKNACAPGLPTSSLRRGRNASISVVPNLDYPFFFFGLLWLLIKHFVGLDNLFIGA
jgi:hypothetical protein